MKTIALATDFTPSANRVAQFAMQLAHDQKASLLLIHAFQFWPDNPSETDGDFPLSADAMHDDSERRLGQLARDLHERYGTDVPIHCLTQQGHTLPAIRKAAEAEHVDLLVMSTVGSAPQGVQFMGSVATDMVAETHVPLLLVPPAREYGGIKNVVLGVDLDSPPEAAVFDTVVRFATAFGCLVNVVCVHDQPAHEALRRRADLIRGLLVAVPHTLTIMPGMNVFDTLLTFAQTNKADLIVMLPQVHNWFRKLFTDGETQQMARLTNIPLLAIV